jgi:hypothetical protein
MDVKEINVNKVSNPEEYVLNLFEVTYKLANESGISSMEIERIVIFHPKIYRVIRDGISYIHPDGLKTLSEDIRNRMLHKNVIDKTIKAEKRKRKAEEKGLKYEEITLRNFQDEMMEIMLTCSNNKPSTIRKKANFLYSKYRGIIFWDKKSLDDIYDRDRAINRAIESLKCGFFEIGNKVIPIKSVAMFERRENSFEITLVTNEKLKSLLRRDYLFLDYIF